MPNKSEKEAWLHIIEPDELDTHLVNIKQANTNAAIIKDLFKKYPLKEVQNSLYMVVVLARLII
jgi:hypothetical protein